MAQLILYKEWVIIHIHPVNQNDRNNVGLAEALQGQIQGILRGSLRTFPIEQYQ